MARVDPLTLETRDPTVALGEYHFAWSFSPDATQLAVGISAPAAPGVRGRIGIRIVDLDTMTIVSDIETGAAAEAIAWVAPERLVAVDVRRNALLVDPSRGLVLRRSPLPVTSGACPWKGTVAVSRRGLVLLLADAGGVNPELAVLEASGAVRTVPLDRVRIRSQRDGTCDRPGVAVDSVHDRALVFAVGSPVAEVDLSTLRVRYHRIDELASVRSGALTLRRALWIGNGLAAVFGVDIMSAQSLPQREQPAGVILVDTARWAARTVQSGAKSARLVFTTVLIHGGNVGLRGVGLKNSQPVELFHWFQNKNVPKVESSGAFAYAVTQDSVHVIDVGAGTVLRVLPAPREFFQLLSRFP